MHYTENPRAFRTSHWRKAYHSYVPDIASVCETVQNGGAIFVVLDAEPWGGDQSKPSEVGITLMAAPRIDDMGDWSSPTPATLEDATRQYKLESHLVSVVGHDRPVNTTVERHRFGREHSDEAEQVGNRLTELVRLFHRAPCDSQPDIPVILVGFAVVYELALVSKYKPLAALLRSWLDVQELAAAASGTTHPGLSSSLKACGFGSVNPKDLQSNAGQHNAATDTVRTAAVLMHLLRMHRTGDNRLTIPHPQSRTPATHRVRLNRPLEFAHDKRIWEGQRPRAKELYPFTVRVKRSSLRPSTAQELFNIFHKYHPVAAGSGKKKSYGWVCLESLDALYDFVRRVDGTDTGEADGAVWSAVADYDDSISPIQCMTEGADAKKKQRQLKRLAQACP
ncbi:hypothetical protein NLG97_g758 [Lecanicillium saksenae]|uniref:Uncharacterized protein n=1 Tax=Lecanicillium saksenae TaxID=468837 RepID=A0ACC1R6Y2_9HYPO|nr:hypothetical protein NLG97_g758 [Lecanicillium saksenae]